jgi:hypothetical protein
VNFELDSKLIDLVLDAGDDLNFFTIQIDHNGFFWGLRGELSYD